MESVLSYFHKWNIPFHKFFLRHMLNPLINSGFNETVALFLVFLYSALFHIALISIPFRILTGWFIILIIAMPIFIIVSTYTSIFVERLIAKYTFILNWTLFIMTGPCFIVLFIYFKSNDKFSNQLLYDIGLNI